LISDTDLTNPLIAVIGVIERENAICCGELMGDLEQK
jgi:hypothetical protein